MPFCSPVPVPSPSSLWLLLLLLVLVRCPVAQGEGCGSVSYVVDGKYCSQGFDVLFHPAQGLVTNELWSACGDSGIVTYQLTDTPTVRRYGGPFLCPGAVAFSMNPQNLLGYVACTGSGLLQISTTQATTVSSSSSSMCASINNVEYDSTVDRVLVACGSNGIVAYTPTTFGPTGLPTSWSGRVLANSSICEHSTDVTVDNTTGIVYATCGESGVIAIQRDEQITQILPPDACNNPIFARVDKNRSELIVACAVQGIIAVDINSNSSISSDGVGNVTLLADSKQCSGPQGVFTSQGVLYAACSSSGVVSLRSANGVAVVNTLIGPELCNQARSITRDPTTELFYAACSNGIIQFSGNSLAQLVPSQSCPLPASVTRSRNGTIFAACSVGGAVRIRSGFLQEFSFLPLCADVFQLRLDANETTLFAACRMNGLNALDLQSGLTRSIPLGDCMGLISFQPAEDSNSPFAQNYIVCFNGIFAIDVRNGTNDADAAVEQTAASAAAAAAAPPTYFATPGNCSFPTAMATDPDRDRIFVMCDTGIYAIDTSTLTETLLLSPSQCGMVDAAALLYDRLTGHLFASCSMQQKVAVTDTRGSFEYVGVSCIDGQQLHFFEGVLLVACSNGVYSVNMDTARVSMLASGTECSGALSLAVDHITGTVLAACTRGLVMIGSRFRCLAGYAWKSGRCEPCEAGYYRTAINQSVPDASIDLQCAPCPRGLVASEPGSMACAVCPAGQTGVFASGKSCVTCLTGYYVPTGSFDCESCANVEGLSCSNGLASVAAGYWPFQGPVDPVTGVRLYRTQQCPPSFCPGTQLQSADAQAEPLYCVFPRRNSADNTLCGACVDGYIPWGGKCAQCERPQPGLIVGLIFVSFALALFLIRSVSAAGFLSVWLYFVQATMLSVDNVLPWLDWLNVSNFSAATLFPCMANLSTEEQTLLSLLSPLVLLTEVWLFALMHRLLTWYIANMPSALDAIPEVGSPNDQSSFSRSLTGWFRRGILSFGDLVGTYSSDRYIGGSIGVLLFSHMQITTTCITYFHCVEVGEESVLFAAPVLSCRSDTYRRYLGVVVFFMILFVVLLPLAVTAILVRQKSAIAKAHTLVQQQVSKAATIALKLQHSNLHNNITAESSKELVRLVNRWGPLFVPYSPNAWMWQPIVLLRQTGFVVASVLLSKVPAYRFMTFVFLHIASLQLCSLVKPFSDERINQTNVLAHLLMISAAVLLTAANAPPYPVPTLLTVFVLIAPPAIIGFVITLVEQMQTVLQLYEERKAARLAKREARARAAVQMQAQYERSEDGAHDSATLNPDPADAELTMSPLHDVMVQLQETDADGAYSSGHAGMSRGRPSVVKPRASGRTSIHRASIPMLELAGGASFSAAAVNSAVPPPASNSANSPFAPHGASSPSSDPDPVCSLPGLQLDCSPSAEARGSPLDLSPRALPPPPTPPSRGNADETRQ